MDQDYLDNLKAMCNRASPSPWELWNGYGPTRSGMMAVERIGPPGGMAGLLGAEGRDILGLRDDLEFVSSARTVIPMLIAEIERLQKY